MELPAKDRHSLKQDYDLLEFAINTTEEFKKTVKKMKGLCVEYYRRIMITYNRCQLTVDKRTTTKSVLGRRAGDPTSQ